MDLPRETAKTISVFAFGVGFLSIQSSDDLGSNLGREFPRAGVELFFVG